MSKLRLASQIAWVTFQAAIIGLFTIAGIGVGIEQNKPEAFFFGFPFGLLMAWAITLFIHGTCERLMNLAHWCYGNYKRLTFGVSVPDPLPRKRTEPSYDADRLRGTPW